MTTTKNLPNTYCTDTTRVFIFHDQDYFSHLEGIRKYTYVIVHDLKTNTWKHGFGLCHPKDQYSKKIGIKTALNSLDDFEIKGNLDNLKRRTLYAIIKYLLCK